MSTSIYEREDALQDTPTEVLTTTSSRVINLIKKRKPVVLIILGTFNWSPPIEMFTYKNDRELLDWVKATIDKGCVIVHCSDDKFDQVSKVADVLHFNTFLIEGVPEHEMTGLATNMTHHMDIINHADVEHISGFVGIIDISSDEMTEEEALKIAQADME